MRHHWLATIIALLAATGSAPATPYWIAWEGDDLPENQGWTRYWGNHDGEYQGAGAVRTIQDGVLTYDSLYDPWVYDMNIVERPGAIDPGPGETFVLEWRLKVDQVNGWADPAVGLYGDGAWSIAFDFQYDRIISFFENLVEIPFAPGAFHTYRLCSDDMRAYEFYIDGALVRVGAFTRVFTTSEVNWGDEGYPAASLHSWDYFRFGVTPEPSGLVALAILVGCVGWRKR
jgi:hypothetical protein